MMQKKNNSAILTKYYNLYKKNPRSLAFAPLAESYRKLGMLEEAFKILKEGIKFHPQYPLGFIVLAHCYYDQEKYELTYNTLRPIISQNSDNISLQKLFALSCIHLGYLEEALETFKYLLFMNPLDKFFAAQVKKLEDDLEVGHKTLSLDQLVRPDRNNPDLSRDQNVNDDQNDWVHVQFTPENKETKNKASEDEDQWFMHKPSLEKPPEKFPEESLKEAQAKPEDELGTDIKLEGEVVPRSLEDEFFADEFADDGDIDEMNESLNPDKENDETPLISHTLIDLYCSQKYYHKAADLLIKIIETNPDDDLSKEKLKQVKKLQSQSLEEEHIEEHTEESGHLEILSLIEKNKEKEKIKSIEKAFYQFLDCIQQRASEF